MGLRRNGPSIYLAICLIVLNFLSSNLEALEVTNEVKVSRLFLKRRQLATAPFFPPASSPLPAGTFPEPSRTLSPPAPNPPSPPNKPKKDSINENKNNNNKNNNSVVPAVILAVLGAILVACVFLCCYKCRKNRKFERDERPLLHLSLTDFSAALVRRAFLSSFSSSSSSTSIATRFNRIRSLRSMATASADPFRKIQIQRDDTTFDAYVVGKENAPGIVVVQEWWGVDFEIKNHALHISQLGQGYKALIPDLYRGKVGLDVAEAQHLMEGLDWQGAVKDIQASVNWLKANGSSKVGVTGYCMGGALAIASGVLIPEVDAVVAFYGVPSAELANPAQAKAPIQAHFGEQDSFVGFSDVTAAKSLEEKLKASNVPHEVHIYPNCGHAFMNTSPEGMKRRKGMGLDDESPEAVGLAWGRFSSWMSRFLG